MEKYPLIEGEVAFVKATDEAVFVVNLNGGVKPGQVLVRRAVQTSDKGAQYVEEVFPVEELQTEKQRLIKEMEFIKFSSETRDRYSAEYQRAKSPVKSVSIPQADGNSGLPN